MKIIKKYTGILCIAMGIYAGYMLIITQAVPKFKSGNPEDLIPAIIYACVLTPIIVGGLITFGVYALQGAYNNDADE